MKRKNNIHIIEQLNNNNTNKKMISHFNIFYIDLSKTKIVMKEKKYFKN